VRRREFITLLGGAAATWPLAARAQQHPPMGVPSQSSSVRHPVIGFLYTILAAEYGFRRGLNETGFVEGTNLAIDYRSLAGQFDRLSQLAADLAGRNVAAIICIDNDPATRAAIAATRTIPIVFTTAGNPVELGFVSSWNRPGANVTGITTFGQELLPKRLELLREILPTATKVAVLSNPATIANSQVEIQSAKAASQRLGLEPVLISAGTESEIEQALTAASQARTAAVMVISDAFLSSRHEYVAVLALRYGLPTISADRNAVVAGQLLSYGPNSDELYQLAGTYVGRILKGERPANLPVMQPTKFELVINLKTARTLGLEIPPTLLARADEVIE
jgi:putative ABC transport system substrate-binding protein